jgi:hypothetical protein
VYDIYVGGGGGYCIWEEDGTCGAIMFKCYVEILIRFRDGGWAWG